MAKKSEKKSAKSDEKSLKDKAKSAAAPSPEDHEHVPAEAENFEHTLKRLITERDEKRAANAGLYR
ncbi:MAG: hypothetical protein KDA73_08630 [Rhodobacteraceae bacterium]|nr:hypothetical protein [Paracoccaceae bacterium]